VDISPLADAEFALLHGPNLKPETDGNGPVHEQTSDAVTGLRYVSRDRTTAEPVGLLAQALDLVREHRGAVELQLDLKPYAPLSEAILARLAESLADLQGRVRVTSPADWALRRLRALDGDLLLGFDPLLYLDDAPRSEGAPERPPYRLGAFGYWDDHPLASRRWGTPAQYLAARAEALAAQAAGAAVWYLAGSLLARSLDDGFDWIATLHAWGCEVDAWTLDADSPEQVALGRRLAARGLDRITSNDAPALAGALTGIDATF
jgi:glycerophosphoryl diester phosphodiesterase